MQVRGYAPRQLPAHSAEAAACAAQLEELMKAKQELLYELHAYEYANTIGTTSTSGERLTTRPPLASLCGGSSQWHGHPRQHLAGVYGGGQAW